MTYGDISRDQFKATEKAEVGCIRCNYVTGRKTRKLRQSFEWTNDKAQDIP